MTVRQGRVALNGGDHVDEPKSAQRRETVPVELIHPGTTALLRHTVEVHLSTYLPNGGADGIAAAASALSAATAPALPRVG